MKNIKEGLKKVILNIVKKKGDIEVLKTEEIFTNYHKNNKWKSRESISGTGSELLQCQIIIQELEILLHDLSIAKFVDIPCGDFNWMKEVKLNNVKYIGGDIVNDLIQSNNDKYLSKNVSFIHIDILSGKIPECDLLLVRDCFVHLSYKDIIKGISNIKKSNIKYLLATTFTDIRQNKNIKTGQWRKINLEISPFNFGKPIKMINENCTEANGSCADKSLGLWDISNL